MLLNASNAPKDPNPFFSDQKSSKLELGFGSVAGILIPERISTASPEVLLGIASRPPNSKNCGLFKDGALSNTYGMPSGHAQISWLFATYWSLKIWNDKRGATSKIISIMVLCFFATMVTYSRVYWAKCHTVQQVVVGSVVGIILGNISYKGLQIYFPPAN